MLSHIYFDLKSHRESPVPTTVVTGPEIRSTSAEFMKDDHKVEKAPVFNQKYSESANTPISEHFNWADDAREFPTSLTLPETSPTKACLIQNQPKFHESTSFGQNHLKPCIAEPLSWADGAGGLPISSITHLKHPRNFSGLHSSSKNPFSSLRRRRRQPRKFHSFINSFLRSCCHSYLQ